MIYKIIAYNGTTDIIHLSLTEAIELFCLRHKLGISDIKLIEAIN